MNESRSKAPGELSAVEEKKQLVTQSSNVEPRPSISDMLENSPIPQTNQIGFQPIKTSGELDETTSNVNILMAFADKLGELVEWKRLTLADGRLVYALCFPADKWKNDSGKLVPVRSVSSEK